MLCTSWWRKEKKLCFRRILVCPPCPDDADLTSLRQPHSDSLHLSLFAKPSPNMYSCKQLLSFVAFASVLLLDPKAKVYACSCSYPGPTMCEIFQQANVVVRGTVIFTTGWGKSMRYIIVLLMLVIDVTYTGLPPELKHWRVPKGCVLRWLCRCAEYCCTFSWNMNE